MWIMMITTNLHILTTLGTKSLVELELDDVADKIPGSWMQMLLQEAVNDLM